MSPSKSISWPSLSSLNFGVLPDALEASLSMANTKAIIGNDIFSHFSLIFHYANKKIYIKHL